MANIIIVEDIVRSRAALKELIKLGGHNVIKDFSNPEEAYNYILKNKKKIDLVILDYNLKSFKNGKEYTGIDLLEEIIKLNNKIKIIFVSAYTETNIIKNAMFKGALDFIIKPYDSQDLLNRLNNVLKQ
ncbi:MAG: response regulator [Spirochaetes bacterium]|nr:response regulator [Spirochaetota bacterium]